MVVFLSLLAIVGSVLIVLLVHFGFGVRMHLPVALVLAALIPALLSPLLFWRLVSLLVRSRRLEAAMWELATFDHLTGLMNRRAFIDRARACLDIALAEGEPMSVLVVDLDDFKRINDRYGHACGDEVLRAFGDLARDRASEAPCGRMGGEEFWFLLRGVGRNGARMFADSLHRTIRDTAVCCDERRLRWSASIGIAVTPRGYDGTLEQLFRRADQAMYQAKRAGKNRTVVHVETAVA